MARFLHEAYQKSCKYCGKEFTTNKRNKFYCNSDCQIANIKKRNKEIYESEEYMNLSIASKGAIAEYAVLIDLMKQGYDAYLHQSPNSYCDIVAYNPSTASWVFIEVRSGNLSSEGVLIYGEGRSRNAIYAIYDRITGEIEYVFPGDEPLNRDSKEIVKADNMLDDLVLVDDSRISDMIKHLRDRKKHIAKRREEIINRIKNEATGNEVTEEVQETGNSDDTYERERVYSLRLQTIVNTAYKQMWRTDRYVSKTELIIWVKRTYDGLSDSDLENIWRCAINTKSDVFSEDKEA
jgi:hypothetical protein